MRGRRRPVTGPAWWRYGLASGGVEHRFTAPLWRYPGKAGWRFITVDHEVADDIEATAETGGFGSVKVRATIGATTWETSLFPSKAEESYVLPVKAAVRTAEGLDDGDVVAVQLTVIDRVAAAPSRHRKRR